MQHGEFPRALLAWFDCHGRRDLPWQQDITPYRVWVSEIMLQQTQVKTVIPYYQRFMQRFPDLPTLASADEDEVLRYWAGLGYYSRGRNLLKAAQTVAAEYGCRLPLDQESLENLPGIGRSTAGAILAIAGDQRAVILDGNVKRVLCRFFAIDGWPGKTAVMKRLWLLADECTPEARVPDYTQAIMDLGATLCTRSRPGCDRCPLNAGCLARLQGRVTDYPESRPGKPLPVRKATMLILENEQQQILLERQPSPGIWGGLWSLPRFEKGADAYEMLEQKFPGYRSAPPMPAFSHRFTHFQLDITPLHFRVKNHGNAVMEAGRQVWYKSGFELPGGLPKPVSRLLNTLID